MNIVDATDAHAEAMAAMLVEEFTAIAPGAWPTMTEARAEVDAMRGPEHICRVALDDGEPAGWIGGIPGYDGAVWELHPLVVRASHRRRGIGRALVSDLERIVAARGALTLTVGSDDEMNLTSIGGIDLYPDPLQHLVRLTDVAGHPMRFYLACGFAVTGVLPDANGFGKPDIFFSKRVASRAG